MNATKTGAAPAEDSLLARIVAKALGRLTFTTSGLRVVLDPSSYSYVYPAADVPMALGRANSTGTGIQLSQQAYNCGFRRNLVVS